MYSARDKTDDRARLEPSHSGDGTTVQLQNTLTTYVPAGTVVTFIQQALSGDPNSAIPFSFNLTTSSTQTANNLAVLTFNDASGVTVGMQVGGDPSIATGTYVAEVDTSAKIVTLSKGFTAAPTGPITVTFTLGSPVSPFANFAVTATSGTPAAAPTKIKFPSTNGIAVGMTVEPVTGLVDPGTVVTNVTNTIVTVSKALLANVAGKSLTFIFPVSSGIVQHTEVIGTTGFLSLQAVLGSASVATAVIPLFAPPPTNGYLDITIQATRDSEVIPVNTTFYNVLVQNSALPTPDQFQEIPDDETSLYIALPPPPVAANSISLVIPSDGSAPEFNTLLTAMQNALQNDPIQNVSFPLTPLSGSPAANPTTLNFTAGQTSGIVVGMGLSPIPGLVLPNTTVTGVTSTTISLSQALLGSVSGSTILTFTAVGSLIGSPSLCTRVAYDVVWSYQNALPAPPDALESLYTNPPNPGGSADNSDSGTNNLEQDRQKFEGTLNSFYSTRNATAERLTKFVAAVSAAVLCEQASLNSAAALLEFPVDPTSPFATEVESELLLQGVEANGSGGVTFGVPAAFFYALTSNLDKSTSAQRRFQQATGDDIERLLQQFEVAENAGILGGATRIPRAS